MRGGALLQERQIETEEVMVLDHIRVTLANKRAQVGDEARLIFGPRSIEGGRQPATIAYGNHEDTPAMGVKGGCFKVELQPVQVLVAQTPEIDAPARHEVLFYGANSVVLIW